MNKEIVVKDESFPSITDELLSTFIRHYKEAESKRNKKIKPNFDVERIKHLLSVGQMKAFIARDSKHNIIGYSFMLITDSDLFTRTPSASNVALYVVKKHRKNGVMEKIIRFQDDILKKMNIYTIFSTLKKYHGKKKMEKLGYEFVERTFQKVLI
jgi:predicted acetyltransferase